MTKSAGEDLAATIGRYAERYRRFGYSPQTLGWDKGKQDIRFQVLLSPFDCAGKRVLDIGCGFGDLNRLLRRTCGDDYEYVGVDLVPDLLGEARRRYAGANVRFVEGDFLSTALPSDFDFALSSGMFNHKLEGTEPYALIRSCIEKAWGLCREGIAFDFLSDKVDYEYEHTLHSSPERILALGYDMSRNVVLRNDYMPFEFSLFVFKDGAFLKEDTVFQRFKREGFRGWRGTVGTTPGEEPPRPREND